MTTRTGQTVEVDNRDGAEQIRHLTAQCEALKRENADLRRERVRLVTRLDEVIAMLRRMRAGMEGQP